MSNFDYEREQTTRRRDHTLQALHSGDARVGLISVRDSRVFSAACDRWLESRGVRTRSVWWDSQIQKREKKNQ